jgi:hypothetical protein
LCCKYQYFFNFLKNLLAMMISYVDRLKIWLLTGQFPAPLPTSKTVFMTAKFSAEKINEALEKVLSPAHRFDKIVGIIVSPNVYNGNEKDNAKLALYTAIIPLGLGPQNPQQVGQPIEDLFMDQQEVVIGSQFYSNVIDFDFVFFPTSEVKRLLSVKDAQGLEFTKTYHNFNGPGGKDFLYQNLVATPYPNGFFEQAKAGKSLVGSELTEYSSGFACPPIWGSGGSGLVFNI